jgi:hypothetical protein
VIYADSRYARGIFFKAYNLKNKTYSLTVLRRFPVDQSNFYYYVWRERDRVENVAARLLGDANLWWRIMDYNPEVIDPINIAAGTPIRIPSDEQT